MNQQVFVETCRAKSHGFANLTSSQWKKNGCVVWLSVLFTSSTRWRDLHVAGQCNSVKPKERCLWMKMIRYCTLHRNVHNCCYFAKDHLETPQPYGKMTWNVKRRCDCLERTCNPPLAGEENGVPTWRHPPNNDVLSHMGQRILQNMCEQKQFCNECFTGLIYSYK